MNKSILTFSVWILVAVLVIFYLFVIDGYQNAQNIGGAIITIVGVRPVIEFILGAPIHFAYAGIIEKNKERFIERIVIFIFSIGLTMFGLYMLMFL